MLTTTLTRRTLLGLAALALGAGVACRQTGVCAAAAKKRILMISVTSGFRHDSIETGEQVVKELGAKTGQWDLDYARTPEDLKTMVTANNLKRYHAVFFGNTTGADYPIPTEGRAALLAWIRSGRGFIGTHSATDTGQNWPEYGRLIGGYFDGHPWHEPITAVVEDPNHPSTKGLPKTWEITDEMYQFRNWTRDDKRVLLSIANDSIDASKGNRADKDYAISWVRSEGKGRVFYTSLGHRKEVWMDPRFQQHLVGGIRWALGLAKGDAAPVKK